MLYRRQTLGTWRPSRCCHYPPGIHSNAFSFAAGWRHDTALLHLSPSSLGLVEFALPVFRLGHGFSSMCKFDEAALGRSSTIVSRMVMVWPSVSRGGPPLAPPPSICLSSVGLCRRLRQALVF